MKKLLICLTVILLANIAVAQKDSILKVLEVQQSLFTLLDQQHSNLEKELDSINVLIAKVEIKIQLLTTGMRIIKTTRKNHPDDVACTSQTVAKLIKKIDGKDAESLDSLQLLAESNSVIDKQIAVQWEHYKVMRSKNFTCKNRREKKILQATIEEMYIYDRQLLQKFNDNNILSQTVLTRAEEHQKKLTKHGELINEFVEKYADQ